MVIKTEKKEISLGKFKTTYTVATEAINEYTNKRIQKFKSNISTIPKAKKIEKELWSFCKYSKPKDFEIKLWKKLKERYLTEVNANIRTEKNLNGEFSIHTVKNKKSRLAHTDIWDKLHLKLITPNFVKNALDNFEKEKGIGRRTTADIQMEIKTLFSFAVSIGVMTHNPFRKVSRKVPDSEKDAFTLDEANILLEEAYLRSHPYFLIWLISIFTGLRRSELAGLKWTDCNFAQKMAKIQRQYYARADESISRTKTGKNRKIPFSKKMMPVLKKYKLGSRSKYVISFDDPESREARYWRNGNQAQILREFCREIGIKEIAHRDLRATFITLALEDNCPLGVVKEIAGHDQLSTTDIYFRRSGLNLRDKTDGLSIKVPSGEFAKVFNLAIGDNKSNAAHIDDKVINPKDTRESKKSSTLNFPESDL